MGTKSGDFVQQDEVERLCKHLLAPEQTNANKLLIVIGTSGTLALAFTKKPRSLGYQQSLAQNYFVSSLSLGCILCPQTKIVKQAAKNYNTFKKHIMKLLLTTLLLIFNMTVFAQSNAFVGDYNRTLTTTENDMFDYKLTLHADGTFLFHYNSKIKNGIPPEVNKYGKGKWIAKDNVITFSSNKQEDFDEKYTLDFNNSKARFVTKNPRDKTDRIIKTKLTFVESEIPWMQRLDIFKI
jgi:hypothetical protein